MTSTVNKNAFYVFVIFLLLFFIGFQWSYDDTSYHDYRTDVNLDGGDYVRFVFIGSSHCGFSNDFENHNNILDLKETLKNHVRANNLKFISTGISVDMNAYQGFKYLEKTGPYDEILSGSSWFNIGVDRYVWDNFQGYPSTPQIVLIKSEFMVEEFYGIKRSERVLKRVSGKNDIDRMLEKVSQLKGVEILEWLEL